MIGRHVVALALAGHDQRVGVLVDRHDRADAGELVPHLGLHREMFADLHSRNVGLDRIEFAAEFDRRIGLEVVHVHVRRTARQVDHDRGLVPRRRRLAGWGRGGRAQLKHVGQRQTGAERADLEEIATVHAIAEALAVSPDSEHR